jgi:hypothetical protein
MIVIMLAYTSKAPAGAGGKAGMQALINYSLAEANLFM